MKYIRTKDEIGILVEEKDNEELQKLKSGINDMVFKDWCGNDKKNIIAQADTIEELCDEFVWNLKESNKRTVANNIFPFSRIKLDLDKQFHGDYEIYGAIWTGKGLIYVAKMNDKGELELI